MNSTEPNSGTVPPRIPAISEVRSFLKRCTTIFKMAGVALLILLLLAPLAMIRAVLHERLGRRNEAVANITLGWGGDQTIIGPVLIVPYRYSVRTWKEQSGANGKTERVEVVGTAVANAYFLPAAMKIDGASAPSELHRGIYHAVVYSAKLDLQGEFARPDFTTNESRTRTSWGGSPRRLYHPGLARGEGDSAIGVGRAEFSAPTGQQAERLLVGHLCPGCRLAGEQRGHSWKLGLTLRGSGGLAFAPIGIQCSAKLASPWPDPSFRGAFLPTERNITHDGFTAIWQVSYYGRNYAQQWTDQDSSGALTPDSAQRSAFGVSLISGSTLTATSSAPSDGVLFLLLVFTSFFLFECVLTQDSPVPVCHRGRGALPFLSRVAVTLGVRCFRPGVSRRRSGHDVADLLLQREGAQERKADLHYRGSSGGHLRVPLCLAPAPGLLVTVWNGRAVCGAGDRHPPHAEHRLVCARPGPKILKRP